jgi:predicted nucleotidyltransferase
MSGVGTKRTNRAAQTMSVVRAIVLQKSKVASARIFGETLKRETIDDSDSLSRAIEVADEFSVRR